MRRRRVIVGLAVLAVPVAAVALWPRGPRPCRETFEQVREGMAFEEVCATVGGPPGDYTGRPRAVPNGMVLPLPPFLLPGGPPEVWIGEDGELIAWFDPGGQVVQANVYPVGRPPFWSRLLARLGL